MPEKGALRLFRVRGLRNRWMLSSMAVMLLLTVVALIAYTAAVGSYYYSSMRTGLETKASSSSAFSHPYSAASLYMSIAIARLCWTPSPFSYISPSTLHPGPYLICTDLLISFSALP